MASEYVSYMLVFGLGISMVVAITITMQDISTSVFESSAEVEFDNLMEMIKDLMNSMISNFKLWDGLISYDYNLDIPTLLVDKFYYEISIVDKNGSYQLIGNTISSESNIMIVKNTLFGSNQIIMSGKIESIDSNPYISLQSDFMGQLTLQIGNL